MRTIWRDWDGYDTRVTRLRAWSRLSGWRFESSSAHRKALHSGAFRVSVPQCRTGSPERGNFFGNIGHARVRRHASPAPGSRVTAGTTTRQLGSSRCSFGSTASFEESSLASTCPHVCPESLPVRSRPSSPKPPAYAYGPPSSAGLVKNLRSPQPKRSRRNPMRFSAREPAQWPGVRLSCAQLGRRIGPRAAAA
jgi:hypothetical protein